MQQADLAEAFLTTKSFRVDKANPIVLSSGRRSEYYINCKQLLSHPKYRIAVADLIFNTFTEILDRVDVVGGMEIGAIPIASVISDYYYHKTGREIRTFTVRKKAKEHGLGMLVEGDYKRDDKALVVDDVLTTGKSTKDAIENARASGLIIAEAIFIVDRGEDSGKESLEKLGVKVLSLLTLTDLKLIKEKKQNSSNPAFISA